MEINQNCYQKYIRNKSKDFEYFIYYSYILNDVKLSELSLLLNILNNEELTYSINDKDSENNVNINAELVIDKDINKNNRKIPDWLKFTKTTCKNCYQNFNNCSGNCPIQLTIDSNIVKILHAIGYIEMKIKNNNFYIFL